MADGQTLARTGKQDRVRAHDVAGANARDADLAIASRALPRASEILLMLQFININAEIDREGRSAPET